LKKALRESPAIRTSLDGRDFRGAGGAIKPGRYLTASLAKNISLKLGILRRRRHASPQLGKPPGNANP
jgi:hypothetical protein